jgi:hypothetical protein
MLSNSRAKAALWHRGGICASVLRAFADRSLVICSLLLQVTDFGLSRMKVSSSLGTRSSEQ